jgi:hypothetical protein
VELCPADVSDGGATISRQWLVFLFTYEGSVLGKSSLQKVPDRAPARGRLCDLRQSSPQTAPGDKTTKESLKLEIIDDECEACNIISSF